MTTVDNLTKAQLVELVEQLRDDLMAANLRQVAPSGGVLGAGVSSELADWLHGLELPPAAGPVAALAHHLAARLDGVEDSEGLRAMADDKAVAGIAKELRAAMAEIRELTAGADVDDEDDAVEAEVRELRSA